MTILERHNRNTDRKSLYFRKPSKQFLRQKTRVRRVKREFQQLANRIGVRRWQQAHHEAENAATVELDSTLLEWLEVHVEHRIFRTQHLTRNNDSGNNGLSLAQLANELIGSRQWLNLYGGDNSDPRRKKNMINVLNRIQRCSESVMVTNWKEVVEALQDHMTIVATTTEDEEQRRRRPVRDYFQRLDQIELETRHEDSNLESKRLWGSILIPEPEKDYEAEDALLQEQLEQQPDDGAVPEEEEEDRGVEPLTPEQRQEFYDTIDHGPKIVAKRGEDVVQHDSLKKLLSTNWLNDEVIHFYLQLLSRPGHHFFKSFFITRLRNEGSNINPGVYEYKNVKRWSKKVEGKDIFKLDKVFFPVNQTESHWTLAVAFVQERRLQYYDSMHGPGMSYLRDLERYFNDEHLDKKKKPDDRSWTLVPCTPNTPRQRNGFDCGVFLCTFCEFLSRDRPLTFTQEDVTICRERIGYSIIRGEVVN